MLAKLTDARLRGLKASGKTQKIADGGGLYIELTPQGAKLWRLAYRFDGKQKKMALGKYPEVSLAEARNRRDAAKALLAEGKDPATEKKRAKVEAEKAAIAEAMTFERVAYEWLDVQKETWAASNFKKKLRLVETLVRAFGQKPISELMPVDIATIIKPIDACGKTVTAHALAQTASQVCRFARASGYCMFNAADGLTSVLRPIKSKPRAALLDPADIGRMLRAIDNYNGSISVIFALKIMPYVALRSVELRGARWTELDLDNGLWTVPATRAENPKDGGGMKTRIEHEVPLSRQAVELFRQLKACCLSGEWCFPSPKSDTKEPIITSEGFRKALFAMGFSKDDMCIHGFRSIFSTHLNEKKQEWGYDPDAIERQLAHKEDNKVRAVYDRSTYLEPRKRLMQQWADYLDQLRAAAS